METPVEFPYGVVPYGVIGLTLPLVSVKLTGMWVPTTFLRDVLGVLNLWLKYPYQLKTTFLPYLLSFTNVCLLDVH